jgi:hypothetical protein
MSTKDFSQSPESKKQTDTGGNPEPDICDSRCKCLESRDDVLVGVSLTSQASRDIFWLAA